MSQEILWTIDLRRLKDYIKLKQLLDQWFESEVDGSILERLTELEEFILWIDPNAQVWQSLVETREARDIWDLTKLTSEFDSYRLQNSPTLKRIVIRYDKDWQAKRAIIIKETWIEVYNYDENNTLVLASKKEVSWTYSEDNWTTKITFSTEDLEYRTDCPADNQVYIDIYYLKTFTISLKYAYLNSDNTFEKSNTFNWQTIFNWSVEFPFRFLSYTWKDVIFDCKTTNRWSFSITQNTNLLFKDLTRAIYHVAIVAQSWVTHRLKLFWTRLDLDWSTTNMLFEPMWIWQEEAYWLVRWSWTDDYIEIDTTCTLIFNVFSNRVRYQVIKDWWVNTFNNKYT